VLGHHRFGRTAVAKRLKSTVEQYRSGEILEVPYDLSDPLERAIWTALQLYVDHLERRAILAAEGFDRPEVWAALHPYVDRPRSEDYFGFPGSSDAWELEEYLKELREAAHSTSSMNPTDLYEAARAATRALFTPEDGGTCSIPRAFWGADGQRVPERVPEEAETPVLLAHTLMPLADMLRAALGEHVPLVEAAQRLSLAPRAVESRVAQGRLRAIRVGEDLLVSVADLPKG
jgi:hypothetical protein